MCGSGQTDGKIRECDVREDKIIDSLFGNIFLLVMLGGFFLSIAFYVFSYLITDQTLKDTIRGISMILLGAIIASVVHEKVLGDYYKNQSLKIVKTALYPNFTAIETRLSDEIARIAPDVKKETIGSIKDIQERVTEATSAA